MKLNESNARFAIVRTAFHNGGIVSFHLSLTAARAALKKACSCDCACGCVGIVPITHEAYGELRADMIKNHDVAYNNICLLDALPNYSPSLHYSKLCK